MLVGGRGVCVDRGRVRAFRHGGVVLVEKARSYQKGGVCTCLAAVCALHCIADECVFVDEEHLACACDRCRHATKQFVLGQVSPSTSNLRT
jgi:hypothetical protein